MKPEATASAAVRDPRIDAGLKAGAFHEVRQLALNLLASTPDSAYLHQTLGLACLYLGQYADAIASLRRAVELEPGCHACRSDLALALASAGRPKEALHVLDELLASRPDLGEAHFNRGMLLQSLGRVEEAAMALATAADLLVSSAEAHFQAGRMHLELRNIAAAERYLSQAITLDPTATPAWLAWGKLNFELGRMDAAFAAIDRACEIDPKGIESRATRAWLAEIAGRLEDAERFARAVLQDAPDEPRCILVLAKCARRSGRPEEAVKLLEDRLARLRIRRWRKAYASELGRCYDALGRIDDAWRCFVQSKAEARMELESLAAQGLREDWLAGDERACRAEWVAEWRQVSPPPVTPVFLVGFPRSGTTLLDQILAAHSEVCVIEERPAVVAVEQALRSLPGGYPDALVTLTQADVDRLRAIYYEALEAKPGGDRLLVDKTPLNCTRPALIQRLFAGAPFVFAVRHPCDVVLSCFMQNFAINRAMRHFLTLDDAARFYARVLDLWNRYEQLLGLTVHYVRYEDLIERPEEEVRRLLKFLGLSWQPSLLKFHENVGKRRIKTPSYEAVARPLYREARGRWRRYEKYFTPDIRRALAPWLERFDYTW